MKKLLALVTLLTAAASLGAAQGFIIYAKSDYSMVSATTPSTKPSDAKRAGFLEDVQADLAQPPHYDTQMTLKAPPAPEWGKVIATAQGMFQFHESFKGGFLVRLQLDGLIRGHTYRLTLQGNAKLAGNDRLPAAPRGPEDRSLDFFTVAADNAGKVDATFAIALAPGPYDLRLHVTDTSDDTIFLYHDYFRFNVE